MACVLHVNDLNLSAILCMLYTAISILHVHYADTSDVSKINK